MDSRLARSRIDERRDQARSEQVRGARRARKKLGGKEGTVLSLGGDRTTERETHWTVYHIEPWTRIASTLDTHYNCAASGDSRVRRGIAGIYFALVSDPRRLACLGLVSDDPFECRKRQCRRDAV